MFKAKYLAAASAALMTVSLSACAPAESQTQLVFAGFPYGSESDGYDPYGLLVQVLSDELGEEVIHRKAADQAVVVEGLISGALQVAQLSPFGYVLAKQQIPDLELIGVAAASATSPVSYSSYGFTKTGSGIESLADLAGKTLCFSDPISAASYYIPAASLKSEGILVPVSGDQDAKVVFTGGLAEVGFAVDRGDCDAGFVNDLTFDTVLPASGKIDEGSLSVFWKSPGWTNPPLVMQGSLDPALKKRIRAIVFENANKTALVEAGYCTEEATCQMIAPNRWGWQKAEDSAFDGYRELCSVLSLKECS